MKSFKQFITESDNFKITPKIRSDYQKACKKYGLDGNGRFEKVSRSISVINNALKEAGLQLADIVSGDLLLGKQGQRSFKIESIDEQPINNSLVVVTWTELEKGRVEVLSYLS